MEKPRPTEDQKLAEVVENVPSAAFGMHMPFTAKQPPAMLNPLVPVVVPIVVSRPIVEEPKRPAVANRFVVVAVVENSELALSAVEDAYTNCDVPFGSYAENAVAVTTPPTSSNVVGFVAPMPTLPSESTRMRSTLPLRNRSGVAPVVPINPLSGKFDSAEFPHPSANCFVPALLNMSIPEMPAVFELRSFTRD